MYWPEWGLVNSIASDHDLGYIELKGGSEGRLHFDIHVALYVDLQPVIRPDQCTKFVV